MTVEEYEETFFPRKAQLTLYDLGIGDKFYFDHPEYNNHTVFRVHSKGATSAAIVENKWGDHSGNHPLHIPIRKA